MGFKLMAAYKGQELRVKKLYLSTGMVKRMWKEVRKEQNICTWITEDGQKLQRWPRLRTTHSFFIVSYIYIQQWPNRNLTSINFFNSIPMNIQLLLSLPRPGQKLSLQLPYCHENDSGWILVYTNCSFFSLIQMCSSDMGGMKSSGLILAKIHHLCFLFLLSLPPPMPSDSSGWQ